MADLTYNTDDADYVKFLNGLPQLIAYMTPILKQFRILWRQDKAAAKAWAKRDPLLMAFLEFLFDVEKKGYIESLKGEDSSQW